MLPDWLALSLFDLYPAALTLLAFILGYTTYTKIGKQRLQQGKTTRINVQLLSLAISLLGLAAFIVALPIEAGLKGQLLSLLGIVLSAAIALSSTTFIGNAMSGIMLNSTDNLGIGHFIQVNDFGGRITERGLLHTEIQSEDRNLTVLPNLYLVTNPYRIIHSKGTIISVDVSLGYDINRKKIEQVLIAAADNAGLESAFIQITELGDFSVCYRVSGVLKEVKQRVTAKTELHKSVLDALHADKIEIVSPNFMNTRAQAPNNQMIPKSSQSIPETESLLPIESIVFDKAEEAETKESLEHKLKRIGDGINKLGSLAKESHSEQESNALKQRIENLEVLKDRIEKSLHAIKNKSD